MVSKKWCGVSTADAPVTWHLEVPSSVHFPEMGSSLDPERYPAPAVSRPPTADRSAPPIGTPSGRIPRQSALSAGVASLGRFLIDVPWTPVNNGDRTRRPGSAEKRPPAARLRSLYTAERRHRWRRPTGKGENNQCGLPSDGVVPGPRKDRGRIVRGEYDDDPPSVETCWVNSEQFGGSRDRPSRHPAYGP